MNEKRAQAKTNLLRKKYFKFTFPNLMRKKHLNLYKFLLGYVMHKICTSPN